MQTNSNDYSTKAPSGLFKSWNRCYSCDNCRDGEVLGVSFEEKNLQLEHKAHLEIQKDKEYVIKHEGKWYDFETAQGSNDCNTCTKVEKGIQ